MKHVFTEAVPVEQVEDKVLPLYFVFLSCGRVYWSLRFQIPLRLSTCIFTMVVRLCSAVWSYVSLVHVCSVDYGAGLSLSEAASKND